MRKIATTREDYLEALKSLKDKLDHISPMGNHLVLTHEGILDESKEDPDLPKILIWDDMETEELKEWYNEYLK